MTHPPQTPLLRRQVRLTPLGWGLLALAVLAAGLLAGGWLGAGLSGRLRAGQEGAQLAAQIEEQYSLGVAELESGDYARAAQRFQWILIQDPDHEGAIEGLAQALVHQQVDEEAVPDPLELTPTATVERSPDEAAGLLAQAETAIAAGDWGAAIEALVATRQADAAFETARIDRMLFLSLRQQGVRLILQESDLEGGLYHLSLAERFAPVDVEAETVRGWARLYVIGASFWDIYPDRAAFYFGQLAAAAPNLSDSTGLTAFERYVQALVDYADQLAEAEEWCAAAEQYALAQAQRFQADVEVRAAEAAEKCGNPNATETAGATGTATATPTFTPTGSATLPVSLTPPLSETPTPPSTTATPEPTPTSEVTPTPTSEVTSEPTATPTEEPTATPGG